MPDGMLVEGETFTDVVKAMNDTKMTPAKRLSTYRRALAERAKEAYGEEIDPTTDETLITTMISAGLLEPA
jgi:hypothetical protein